MVRWMDDADRWHEGAPRDESEAIEVEHFIVRIPTDEGDRFYTIHYGLTDDFDLDYEIDRIDSEYGGDTAT